MAEKYTNQLIHETSPYLLQHAHNPVNWYAWNEEALSLAKKENKLLLISIGYSACHWCHVMEHESFEDEDVAKIMNDNFICIKVDREERPDVDQVYMDAIQLLTGRGGWPLNCFALPNGQPVYGGTYFRNTDWASLLKQIAQLYQSDPEKLIDQANAIQQGIIRQETAQVKVDFYQPTINEIKIAIEKMAEGFDYNFGGFNGAPKFPMPSILSFLQTYLDADDNPKIHNYLSLTLDQIALGGIYDHVGGGFSRYSVDEFWHIPHFEKMLYDNAQLISIYSKAYTSSKREHYKRVVYESLNFIKRVLTSPEGGFYAALDADSEGEEGKYYVWTAKELQKVLGADYELIAQYYSIEENGNWENGYNVLKSVATAQFFALENNIDLNKLLETLERCETKLQAARNKRIKPSLDDKIITSWNALMLRAYIDAYIAFANPSFLETAIQNATFMIEKLMNADGSLHRTYKNGKSKINGFLDDYAFTIAAFISLYQVSFDESWLDKAKKMTDIVLDDFKDPISDFFFYTSAKDAALAVRKKEISDNVIPSSNSVMAENLLVLASYYNRPDMLELARQMIISMAFEVESYGRFYSNWGKLLTQMASNYQEVVITGEKARDFMNELLSHHPKNVILALAERNSTLPIFEGRFVSNKTLIYVCRNNTCKLPAESVAKALEELTLT